MSDYYDDQIAKLRAIGCCVEYHAAIDTYVAIAPDGTIGTDETERGAWIDLICHALHTDAHYTDAAQLAACYRERLFTSGG